MNFLTTLSCECVDCQGTDCRCGCQADANPPSTHAAAPVCACGLRCGCEAAEQGCLCSPPQS